jgi:hypothetical protein
VATNEVQYQEEKNNDAVEDVECEEITKNKSLIFTPATARKIK